MIAWLALSLALSSLLPWVALGVLVPRWWRKIEPTVRPMLAMFAPAPPSVPERTFPGVTSTGHGEPPAA